MRIPVKNENAQINIFEGEDFLVKNNKLISSLNKNKMFDYNKIININPITPVLTEDSNSDIMLHQSNKISKPIQTSRNDKKEDIRLKYVLTMLDIPILIQFFRDSKITFIDFLFLTKEDLQTLGFKIYQRNRILNFSL